MVPGNTTAFTLVELLVVLGILAVLTSIVVPATFVARAKARQSTCLSNVRQVGLGTLLYTQDFDEAYPPYFDHVEGNRCEGTVVYTGSGKYWTEIVSPYVQRIREKALGKEGGQARLEDLPAVFLCPESDNNPTQPDDYTAGNLSGYGISDHIVNWWAPDHCGGFIAHTNAEVVRPAQCLLLIETFDWFTPSHDRPGAALALSPLDHLSKHIIGAVGTVDGRHSARFRKRAVEQEADASAMNNVFFCDGHVSSQPVKKVVDSADLWSISGTGQWP
jgi:prepilin-type N-terminal cleavage/methylation domain-containing protein/prepilin-type processing-associated H-X9-DG protein